MQVEGLSVALKILMKKAKKVSRNEFIALVNTLGKWTEAVEIH
jgi:hypothetical protein